MAPMNTLKTNITLCALLLLAALPLAAPAQTDGAALTERLKTYHYGGDHAILDSVAQWVNESRSDTARRREAANSLASVLKSDAAFDAKEFACRQLILVASEEQIPVLARTLQNDQLAHYALMVLARIPGEAVNDLLRQEVQKGDVHTRLEIIDLLGERRDLRSISMLEETTSFSMSQDRRYRRPDRFAAAAFALAKMADPGAGKYLRGLYETFEAKPELNDLRGLFADALLLCGDRLRVNGNTAESGLIYDLIDRKSDPIRSASALRGIVALKGEEALPRIIQALREDGSRRQSVAASLLRDLPGKSVTLQLAQALPKLSPRGQTLLLAALGDRADPTATPAVLALCKSSNPDVRAAALQTLGRVGDASSVPMLLQIATSGSQAERTGAHASLIRLRDRAVDTKLMQILDQGQPPLAIEAINVIGERGTATTASLLAVARSRNHEVSAAALKVLRDIGQSADLPKLIELVLSAPTGQRDAAIEAVSLVARRGMDESQRTGAILTALGAKTTPADRADLLTILAQIGGPEALAALRKAVSDPSPGVQATSLRLLSEWQTDEPMAELLRTVQTAQEPTQRAIALRGYLRMISLNEQRPPGQSLALYRDAAKITRTDDEKRLILAGVQKINSLAALEFASVYGGDPGVRAEAEAAVVQIGRGTLGAWPDETRKALDPIAQNSANESARNSAKETLARIGKFADFVMAWEVSPAYQQDGADYTRLFDLPFPPEESTRASQVPWRLMPVVTNPDQPWLLDLLALWPGEQRVAYLRTAVYSETARDLVLELGSDDGIKAWWNGEVVLTHNIARAVAPAEEKVTVHVKPGWNPLLLKVTQNNQGWGACARFTNPEGSPATGLRFRVPSALEIR